MITSARTPEEVAEAVRGAGAGVTVLPVAGASKPALSEPAAEDVQRLDVSGLSGVLEYDPAELTITALAGTPVAEVQAALAQHGQYLPFDPPLAGAGATLGGTVAAGASGPSALRYGGLRDYVIGVRFVDGSGRLVAGGGKVVKNAAGFDLPKLLIGSIGRLGIIVQLSFKVFPQPPATTTLAFAFGGLGAALDGMLALKRSPVELDALDITPEGTVLARVGGRAETLAARAARLAGSVGETAGSAHSPRSRGSAVAVTTLDGPDESALWREAAELSWRDERAAVVRVGLSIRQIPALTDAVGALAEVRYSLGGTVAWIQWPAETPLERLDAILAELGLPGMALFGDRALLGPRTGGAFGARVKHALDPDHRFLEL